MTEAECKIALAKRHSKDFYITNVKTGPTWGRVRRPNLRDELQGLGILDAWAMKKSWSEFSFTGYEIKVSRSDFRADKKWEKYLPFCHRFYFACPKDLIKPKEIPKGIGLIYIYPEFLSTRVVKRAAKRQVEPDPLMLMYILMNKVDSDRKPFFTDERQELLAWVKHKRENKNLGYKVKSKLIKLMGSAIRDLRYLNYRIREYEKKLRELGDESIVYSSAVDMANYERLEGHRKQKLADELQGQIFTPRPGED